MEIKIPRNLDLKSSIKFINKLEIDENADGIIYNYEDMNGKLEPMGMLLVGSKIREVIREYPNIKQWDSFFEDKSYAANMGFFKSVNQNFGKECTGIRAKGNFISVNGEKIQESYRKALDLGYGTDIIRYINDVIAEDIANVLSKNNPYIKDLMKFCIVEVIRNIYDHSQSEKLWYSGQYWPTKDLIEIAILDEGKGIFDTLRNNKRIVINTPEEALKLSLYPGISKNGASILSKEVNGNLGFGLYMIKSICDYAGSFTVISSGVCLNIENNVQTIETIKFRGTAIRIRINPSKLKLESIQNLLSELSRKGTSRLKELKELSKTDKISISDVNRLEVI